jgi:hypothetical protein
VTLVKCGTSARALAAHETNAAGLAFVAACEEQRQRAVKARERARSQAEYDHAFLIRRDSIVNGHNTMSVAMRSYAGTPGQMWGAKPTGYARRINTGRVS